MYYKLLKKIAIFLIFLIVLTLGFTFPSKVWASFNNANIITDYNMRNSNSMSATDINNFLISKGSWLKNYVIPEIVSVPYPTGKNQNGYVNVRQGNTVTGEVFFGKTVAQLIYDEAQQHSINPRVILSLFQRESSAITTATPASDTTRAWPLFYAYNEAMKNCLDKGCSSEQVSSNKQQAMSYGGVGNQIAFATLWYSDRYDRYQSGENIFGLGKWNDPVKIDGITIICQNIATREMYLYTPHISPAQTNFYNRWTEWFGEEPNAPPPPTNDTANYNLHTYATSVTIKGHKTIDSLAYFGTQLIAGKNASSWQLTINPTLNQNSYTIVYKNEAGVEINSKSIVIQRHKLGDINGDGKIDLLDLSIFSTYWNQKQPKEVLSNFNPEVDNSVNLLDLSILASNWGK